jgi:putative ABC transport system permease protein
MNTYFKMAWRNIWRNKRRTLITAASILFGVFFSIIMHSFQTGSWERILDGLLHSYTGYIQVHAKNYWNERSIDNTFENSHQLQLSITGNTDVKSVIPRLESFALASAGDQTKGVIVIGIDPRKEDGFSALSRRLVDGNFLKPGDKGVMLTMRLAKLLKTSTNDSLVLISQGYHGISAAGKFRVTGIIHLPSPEFDGQLVYMNLPVCQELYGAAGRISSLVVDIGNTPDVREIAYHIRQTRGLENNDVMTWQEMIPEFNQLFQSKVAGGKIMIAILYVIIGFGIFGTLLMMVSERKREFGIMVAIGMQKFNLAIIFSTEMLIIGAIGVVAGVLASIPIVTWYHFHPIRLSGTMAQTMEQYGMDPVIAVSWHFSYFLYQALIIFMLVLLTSLYPIMTILRFKPVKALRG